MRAILEALAKPRYPIGCIYMAVTYQIGAHPVTEGLLLVIYFTIWDYIRGANGKNQ